MANGRGAYLRSAGVVIAALLLLAPRQAPCGNLEMVEKNVEELDSLNREAVGQVPGLPRDGTVDLKAYVTVEGTRAKVKVEEKRITPKAPGTEAAQGAGAAASSADGTIEYGESNRSTIKSKPGVTHVH